MFVTSKYEVPDEEPLARTLAALPVFTLALLAQRDRLAGPIDPRQAVAQEVTSILSRSSGLMPGPLFADSGTAPAGTSCFTAPISWPTSVPPNCAWVYFRLPACTLAMVANQNIAAWLFHPEIP
jgi:hypothetical protein